MALQSDTGEVNGAIVLFRKGQTRPLGVERRVPDGAGIVRKIAQGGKQEMLLYVSAVGDGAINVDNIEVYIGLLSEWVSLLAAPVVIAIDTTERIPVETYPPETFVRVTVTSEIVTLTVDNASVHAVLDILTGLTSGATGVIDAIDGNDITITVTSGVFEDGETVQDNSGLDTSVIQSIDLDAHIVECVAYTP